MKPMVRRMIHGAKAATHLAAWFIRNGLMFQVDPFPEDDWVFTFKGEDEAKVAAILEEVKT